MKQRKSKIICPLTHVTDVGPYTATKIVFSRTKNVTKVGHKSSHCRSKNKTKICIKNTRLDELDGANIKKFMHIKILNKSVEFQLDSGSDLTIINLETWKRLGKPTMIKSSKIARSVTGEKIKFKGELIANTTFNGKTLKLKLFILKNTNNLFGTDWMTQFQLWDLPVNSYCQKIENWNAEAEKLKKELKEAYPRIFSGGLGRCTMMMAKVELQDNIQPVFKKKRNVTFASEQINEEFDRLVKTGVLSKVEYSKWTAPAVYVRKKSKDIRI